MSLFPIHKVWADTPHTSCGYRKYDVFKATFEWSEVNCLKCLNQKKWDDIANEVREL